jgi:hypothetical protein
MAAPSPYVAMLRDLGGKLLSIPLWRRFLLPVYAVLFCGATARAILRPKRKGKKRVRKRADKEQGGAAAKARAGGGGGGKGPGFGAQYRKLLAIAIPSWRSGVAIRFWVYGVLMVSRAALNVLLIRIGSQGLKLITEKQWLLVFRQQSKYMALCLPLAALNASMRYQQNRLAIAMRTNLVQHVHRHYLSEHSTFYRMSALSQAEGDLITTIDQRCTQDIEEFCTETAMLFGNVVKPLTEIVSFSVEIARSLGGLQLAIFLGYFSCSSRWLQLIMPSFGRLTAAQQELEGNFRSMHARILANAEEIAFHSVRAAWGRYFIAPPSIRTPRPHNRSVV